MKGAAAALHAGDLVRVCERLERVARGLPDEYEGDATPRALVADVAAKLRALAADAAELQRVSTFPVGFAAERHGESLRPALGALVLVAVRAFRLAVEVRAEMETARLRGDETRVGIGLGRRSGFGSGRRRSTEGQTRRRSLDDGARDDPTSAAVRALRDTARDAKATGARELALAARELWREIRDAAEPAAPPPNPTTTTNAACTATSPSSFSSSTDRPRVNALKLAAFQRALEAFAWDAWVVLGSAMPNVERASGLGSGSTGSGDDSVALVYARRAVAKPAYHEGRAVRAVEEATAARFGREMDPRRGSESADVASPRRCFSTRSRSTPASSTRASSTPSPTRGTPGVARALETETEAMKTTGAIVGARVQTRTDADVDDADVEDAPCDLREVARDLDLGEDDASFALELLATFVGELRAFVATLVNHDRGGTFARRLTETEARAAANLRESADALVAAEIKSALAALSLAGAVEPFDAGAAARAVGRVSRATERLAEYYDRARNAATNRSGFSSGLGFAAPPSASPSIRAGTAAVEPVSVRSSSSRRSSLERAIYTTYRRDMTQMAAPPPRDADADARRWSEMDLSETSASGGETRSLSEGSRSRALPPRSATLRDVYKSGLYASSTSGDGDGDAGRSSLDGSDARARRWSRFTGTTSGQSSRSASGEGSSSGARSWSWAAAGREEEYAAALAALSPRERRRELRAVIVPKRRETVIDVADLLSQSGGDWAFACGRAGRYAAAAREQCEVLKLVLRRPRERQSRAVGDALAQSRSIAEGASVCHSPPLVDALAALEATLEDVLAKLPEEGTDARRGSKSAPDVPDVGVDVAAVEAATRRRSISRDGTGGEGGGVSETAKAAKVARAPDTDASSSDTDWRARVERVARALDRRVRDYEWASEALSRVETFSPDVTFFTRRRRPGGDGGDDGDGSGSAGEEVSVDVAAGIAKLRELASGMIAAYFLAVDAACAAESTFGAVACGLTSAARASRAVSERDEDEDDDDEDDDDDDGSFGRDDVGAIFARLDTARTALGTMEARARRVDARGCERALAWARGGLDVVAREISVVDVGSSGKRSGAACFFGDEHRAIITTLVSLKRELEDFARDHHAVAPNETPDVRKIAASAKAARREHESGGKTTRAGFEPATSATTTRGLGGDAGDAARRFERATAVDFARSAVVVAVAVMTWRIVAAAKNAWWTA